MMWYLIVILIMRRDTFCTFKYQRFLNPKGRIILGEINDYDVIMLRSCARGHKNVVNKMS